jgi:hypothetical protein
VAPLSFGSATGLARYMPCDMAGEMVSGGCISTKCVSKNILISSSLKNGGRKQSHIAKHVN